MQHGNNGLEKTRAKEVERLAAQELTPAQRRHVTTLASQIYMAQQALDCAKKALDVAQANADTFLLYCAEEKGIALGSDGWAFVQNEFSFVRFAGNPLGADGEGK